MGAKRSTMLYQNQSCNEGFYEVGASYLVILNKVKVFIKNNEESYRSVVEKVTIMELISYGTCICYSLTLLVHALPSRYKSAGLLITLIALYIYS